MGTVVQESNPLETQVGGNHYKDLKIQPIEFIHANNIDFISANIIKYAARHKSKNKDEDMKKIIHYALLGLQLIYDYNGEEIKELLKSFANEKV
jgi:hypothetical protein